LTFECQAPGEPGRVSAGSPRREGYEWFGGTAPPHEALTAYGLMLFRDLSRVYNQVDPAMLERTRRWLLSRKDGQGGFLRRQDFHRFGSAPDHVLNAYIVWALTESSKDDDVDKELAALVKQAETVKDPYFLALVANSLLNRDKTKEAEDLLKALAKAQHKDGYVEGAAISITGSGGRDLQIETTALAVLAWLKVNRGKTTDYRENLQSAAKWLGQQRGGAGAFGSTQATVLTLKALTALTRASRAAQKGELILFVDGQRVSKKFETGIQEVLTLELPEADKHLKAGKNTIHLEVTGENEFPFTLSWSYRTVKPPSAEGCPVRLTTALSKATAEEGETLRLTATVTNGSEHGQGLTVAILGLPAGLTLPEDLKQLKDLAQPRSEGKEPGVIDAWETRGRELILYWRGLAPKQQVVLNLDLIARVPGEYTGPASRAYLYYHADHKCWVEPLPVVIKAKGDR
jgi:hypothetical protein